MRKWMICALAAAWALGACSENGGGSDAGTDAGEDGGQDDRPAAICLPGPFGFSGPAFVDATAAAGLDEAGIDATAFVMTVADLDGDLYQDLVALRKGGVGRDLQRVYMNRPHPDDPEQRIFVEAEDTNIGANRRAGAEGRAVSLHAAGDVDGDGDLDLFAGMYVGEYRFREGYEEIVLDRQEILLNDGSGRFSLIEGGSSVATVEPPANTGAVLFDYDRDGILDLYVANWYVEYPYLTAQQNELYRGHGDGSFSRVTAEAGVAQREGYGEHDQRKPAYGVSHCDIDLDGWQDILVANYGRQWNDLWHNAGDGTFSNIGQSSNFDGDDNTDFTDNEFYRCHCVTYPDECPPDIPDPHPSTNCMARGWPAEDEMPFRLNGNTFAAYCGDTDGDLDMDVLLIEIAHGWAGASSDKSQLLRNDGPAGAGLVFSRIAPADSGIQREHEGVGWNEGDVFGGLFDYDNDADLDVVIGAGAYPEDHLLLYKQIDGHRFVDASRAAGVDVANPHSPVFVDYDRDGDLDLLTGVGSGRYTPWDKNHLFLYENQLGELNNWTRIHLRGAGPPDGANHFGVGAIVKVTAGDLTQVCQIKSAEGRYGSQGKWAAHFGLGHHCEDLTIEVQWPNAEGSIQTLTDVRANYELIITENDPHPTYLVSDTGT